MTNPYQSPADSPAERWSRGPSPAGCALAAIAGALAAATGAGTATGMLSPSVGVAAASVCLLVAIVTLIAGLPHKIPLHAAGPATRRVANVVLTRAMLDDKGPDYRLALQRFRRGEPLVHYGIIFRIDNGDEPPRRVFASAPIARADEAIARRMAEHARDIFNALQVASPEFAAATADRELVIGLLASYEDHDDEIGRIVDDRLTWRLPTSGP